MNCEARAECNFAGGQCRWNGICFHICMVHGHIDVAAVVTSVGWKKEIFSFSFGTLKYFSLL